MSVTRVQGRRARIDVTLEGIAFTRTESSAVRRNTQRVVQIGWDQVEGATIQLTAKGRPVVRVAVVDTPPLDHHRDDAFAVKVQREQSANAHELVQRINAEVEVRRRWREHADERSG